MRSTGRLTNTALGTVDPTQGDFRRSNVFNVGGSSFPNAHNVPALVAAPIGELREMLKKNLEGTYSQNPLHQMGGYVKRMRGLKLYLKVENPKGRRIDRLFAGGVPVGDDDRLKVAFVTEQGVPKKYGTDRRKLEVNAITALRRLLASEAVISPSDGQTVFEI